MARSNSANLDLLRSIAVIAVMIDHLIPTLKYHAVVVPVWIQNSTENIGQAGVLAFFVHTSLVLMYSLERLSAGPRTGSLTGRFYLRRLFRIYPLAIACVVGVVVLHLPPATWHEAEPLTAKIVVANLLLVQNVVSGYSVLAPLWSLPYEVEMYLVLPALYFVARGTNSVRWLSALLALLYVGGYALNELQGHLNMAAYVPCFVSGVLCYALRDRIRPYAPAKAWWLFVLGLIGLYIASQWADPGQPVYWKGWIFCLVLALGINAFEDSRSDLVNRITQRVAMYSYGIYLLHVPVLYLIFNVWGPSSVLLAIAVYFPITLAASITAYWMLESPMINLGRRLTEPRSM